MLAASFSIPREGQLVGVQTTHKRGFTPEEVAARCTDKIVAVADTAPEAIRDQARAYKNHVQAVVAHYMKEAIASDRTTVYNALADAGHPELAELIRRL